MSISKYKRTQYTFILYPTATPCLALLIWVWDIFRSCILLPLPLHWQTWSLHIHAFYLLLSDTVVGIDTQLLKKRRVFVEGIFIEDLPNDGHTSASL